MLVDDAVPGLRRWCRRSPVAQKAMALVASMDVLAALVWTVVPAGSQSGPGSCSFGGNSTLGRSGNNASSASQSSIDDAPLVRSAWPSNRER